MNAAPSQNAASFEDTRVEVNQRALIDKILARYASANAVYRELLQNSNDANATVAEIYFTTATSNTKTAAPSTAVMKANGTRQREIVTQVVYRNNGMPFRPQDWSRLQKIAEGNPDVNKVGAFGVGAYTMFSICESPMILSGHQALQFIWKGDTLWCRTMGSANATANPHPEWTTFLLPSRDPYVLPNLVTFGQFLCASLTFTQSLHTIKVYVNNDARLTITKSVLVPPRPVQSFMHKAKPIKQLADSVVHTTTATTSWLLRSVIGVPTSHGNNKHATTLAKSSGSGSPAANTSSPRGTFFLAEASAVVPSSDKSTPEPDAISSPIQESVYEIRVTLDKFTATTQARYVQATARTQIPPDMATRMERVTKKLPPPTVTIQIFLNAASVSSTAAPAAATDASQSTLSGAEKITQSFAPQGAGGGRIFIGFRTSQTTGLAAHVSAPFLPVSQILLFSQVSLRDLSHSSAFIASFLHRRSNEKQWTFKTPRYVYTIWSS
jgi:Protein of unknown function (DUF3684)